MDNPPWPAALVKLISVDSEGNLPERLLAAVGISGDEMPRAYTFEGKGDWMTMWVYSDETNRYERVI